MANQNGVPPNVKNPEQRLISEYLVAKFPMVRHATRVPLGPAAEGIAAISRSGSPLKASRPWRPEADALVYWDGVLLLIEAKVKDYLNGLAKLPIYAGLVPQTPELAPYAKWEIRTRLVVPRAQEWVNAAAAIAGVEIDLFEPAWMVDYYDYRDRYWTAEYRTTREALKLARQSAGLG